MKEFYISIHIAGSGGHSSKPHLTKNPVIIGFELIQRLNTRLLYNFSGFDRVNLQPVEFNSGTLANIIPEAADIKLKGSYETQEEYMRMQEMIRQSIDDISNSWKITCELLQ